MQTGARGARDESTGMSLHSKTRAPERQGLIARVRARWESLCRRCGRCCYEKDERDGRVFTNYDSPCRYLDESTRLCTVYETRFIRCGDCKKMTIFHALFVSYLPAECGYVQKFRPWLRRASPCLDRGEGRIIPPGKGNAHGRKTESCP